MVFHYWSIKNWEQPRWKLLNILLRELLRKEGCLGSAVRDAGSDWKNPYIQVDEDEGRIMMRRLTYSPQEKQEDLVVKGSNVVTKVRRMQMNEVNIKLKELFKKDLELGQRRKEQQKDYDDYFNEEQQEKQNPHYTNLSDKEIKEILKTHPNVKAIWEKKNAEKIDKLVCPKCLKNVDELPAVSRTDLYTPICEECADREEIEKIPIKSNRPLEGFKCADREEIEKIPIKSNRPLEGFKVDKLDMREPANNPIVNTPCKRCKKSPRVDYYGYCMDCADELKISEISEGGPTKKIFDWLVKTLPQNIPDDKITHHKINVKKLAKELSLEENDVNEVLDFFKMKGVIQNLARGDTEDGKKEIELALENLKNVYDYSKDNPNVQRAIGHIKDLNGSFDLANDNDLDTLYGYYNVPPIDRIRNYQFLVNILKAKANTGMDYINKYFLNPILESDEEKRKAYIIENNLAEKIMKRKNYSETLLPFPAIAIDCALPIGNRFYFAFICGRFYIDRPYTPYVGIITCFIEKVGNEFMIQEQILCLEKEKQKSVMGDNEKANKDYNKVIRNFISGVLGFIHEPDVEEIVQPYNPKNNERRMEKGRLPLPKNTVVIRLTGKKKVYTEKYDRLPSQPKVFRFQQDVPATYIHFRNKTRYKRLYIMSDAELEKRGYSVHNGVVRKMRGEFQRFKDLPRREVTYVLESDVSKKIKTAKFT